MTRAFRDKDFARDAFPLLYERIAPAAVDLMVGERLVRLDRHLTEYFLFQTLWVLFKQSFVADHFRERGGFDTGMVLEAWAELPPSVLKAERNKRQHLSNVLSRNEANRDYTYNRRLFKRLTHGYQFNPALSIRRRGHDDDSWQSVFAALNLPLVHELAYPDHWPLVSSLWTASGGATLPVPIAGENWSKREEALLEKARSARRAAAPGRRATATRSGGSRTVGHPASQASGDRARAPPDRSAQASARRDRRRVTDAGRPGKRFVFGIFRVSVQAL